MIITESRFKWKENMPCLFCIICIIIKKNLENIGQEPILLLVTRGIWPDIRYLDHPVKPIFSPDFIVNPDTRLSEQSDPTDINVFNLSPVAQGHIANVGKKGTFIIHAPINYFLSLAALRTWIRCLKRFILCVQKVVTHFI